MKITEIAVFDHVLPVKNSSFRMPIGQITEVPTTLVRITADNGLVGWGETSPISPIYQPHHAAGDRAALSELAPGLLGVDPTHIVSLHRRMHGLLDGHHPAKAAIDIAAHDLTGKHYGVPVSTLLGGALTDRVPSYYATSAGETVDSMVDKAESAAEEGYPRLQLKVGGRPIEEDIEVIRKVWERVGNRVRLAVDGNRGLTTRDTLRLSRECPDIPFIIEQPCRTIEEIASIRSQLHHAVYLDEATRDVSTVLDAIGRGICDGFGMKVTRVGGLHQMALIRDICEIRSMPHTSDDEWGGDIIAAACVHLASTVQPRLNEGAWIAQPYLDGSYDPDGGIRIEGGHIAVPQGPGLGVHPDATLFGEPSATFG